jgi:Rrf2 family protein
VLNYTFFVNLTLTRRGDYVLRSAICLARAYDAESSRTLRQVSAEMAVPRTFVSQILGDLVHAGIAISSLGARGGYRLARPPGEVSLLELVEAAEGQLGPDACVMGDGPCRWERVCPLHESWKALVASTRAQLAATTLADLAARDEKLEEGVLPVPADAHRRIHAGVAVAESVSLEGTLEVLAARIGAGDAWLAPHLQAASAAGEAVRMRIGPGGPTWLGKTVALRLGAALSTEDGLEVPVAWTATGPASLFPRFDGSFRLRPRGPSDCELLLAGHYRPPLGAAGQVLDEALLARIARATVRTLLRRVANVLVLEASSPQQV